MSVLPKVLSVLPRVGAAIFIAVGSVLLVLLGHQAIQAGRSSSWPTVEGVVTESKVVQRIGRHNGKTNVPRITYRYSVDGIEHVGARLFFGSQFSESWTTGARWTSDAKEYMARYPPGTRLQVHYDPDDAATSVVEAGMKSAIVLPVAFSIVMFGGGIFLWVVERRRMAKLARHPPPSEHKQESDYLYVAIVCVCAIPFTLFPALGIFSLQRMFQPADSLLFGPTVDGQLMILVPTIVLGMLAAFLIAWPLTKWIRRVLRWREKAPIIPAHWAKSIDWKATNWRLVGGIAGVILILIAAKGTGSYFYVTESGISVRPPLEFSMRHYEWKDVTTVRVRCIHSVVKSKNRFRYILKMSDGYDVDWSTALRATTQKVRAAYAARFAEIIPSHLNTVPSILYDFDVSRDGLALLGEKRGMLLPNAIREQVLAHGGTLQ